MLFHKDLIIEHDHELLWIKDAPTYGINSDDGIQSFVIKYITCDKFYCSTIFVKINFIVINKLVVKKTNLCVGFNFHYH